MGMGKVLLKKVDTDYSARGQDSSATRLRSRNLEVAPRAAKLRPYYTPLSEVSMFPVWGGTKYA